MCCKCLIPLSDAGREFLFVKIGEVNVRWQRARVWRVWVHHIFISSVSCDNGPAAVSVWHSRLNIMLLVTASVADRLVGCWLERDCLPVCRRSRPHTLLTSAMEQQTIQQPCSPMGGQTGQPNTHNK